MNVRVESMCQGDGKIYIQVAIDRLSADAIVMLEARLKDGSLIPSHLLSFDPADQMTAANYAVIVPHMDEREIMLDFTEYRSADAPLGHAHLTIETNMLLLRTRLNSVVKNETLAQMFDIEREYYSDRMNVSFITAVEDTDEIVVKMLVDLPQIEGADVEVRFLDAHGKERDLPVYPLFEEVKPARRFGDESRINVGFSVRVPADDKDFCVSAYDALDVVPGGFAMFCEQTFEPLHESFMIEHGNAAQDPTYDEWYLLHSATLADLAEQRRLTFANEPLISLILPLLGNEETLLPRMMAALASQTYNVFEVIVVDQYYSDVEFATLINGLVSPGNITRVKVDEDLPFDEVFAAGLDQAKGDHCALISADVVLAPEALFEVARCINRCAVYAQDPQVRMADIIYAHHDSIHADGTLSDLACKPIYSPDLLLSYEYLGPFVIFAADLIKSIREEESFAADALLYDLVLKGIERTGHAERIDQILYHLQAPIDLSEEAVSARVEAAEEDFRGGRRVVANHLKRIGIETSVLSDIHHRIYRCNYSLPGDLPSVLVVIVNRERPALLEACVESLFERNSYANLSVLIIDDASAQSETFACYGRLEGRYEAVRVVLNKQRSGYAACANQAIAQEQSDFVLLLDPDVEMASAEPIARMVGMCQRPEIGVVGAKLLYADDTIEQAGIAVGSAAGSARIAADLPRTAPGYLKRLVCANEISATSRACQFIRRSVFDEVDGYDERFKLDFSDTDFCLKVIKAGYYVVYDPEIELYHFENSIKDEHLPDEHRIRLEQERAYLHFKWPRAFVEGDPFSSTLLACGSGYYQLYH